MPTTVFRADQDTRKLPIGMETGSHAARRVAGLINEHAQKRSAGTVLTLEGQQTSSVYLVLSGWMCESKSMMDGHRQIVDIVLPGGILEPASADIETSAVEIEALTDVTYASVPRETWFRFVDENAEFGDYLHREEAAAMSRMSERMLRLGKGGAESIIAFALCELCLRSTGSSLDEVKEFHIPMTQQQLGDLCGLSSVHICRTLRRLTRNGILSVRDHMDVTIHDVEALAEIAEIDPDGLQKEIVPRTRAHPVRNCG